MRAGFGARLLLPPLLCLLALAGLLLLGDGAAAAERVQEALGWIEAHVAPVLPYLESWGYPAVFVAIALEGCLIPVPGQTLLMAGALAAASGRLDIVTLFLVGLAGTLTGSFIGYALGRAVGTPLFTRIGLAGPRLDRLEASFGRWGAWLVLVARFMDGPRQLNAPLAGALRMPLRRFALANLAGSVIWIGVWGPGTWLVGSDIGQVARLLVLLKPWLIGGAVLALLSMLLWLLRGRRAAR